MVLVAFCGNTTVLHKLGLGPCSRAQLHKYRNGRPHDPTEPAAEINKGCAG